MKSKLILEGVYTWEQLVGRIQDILTIPIIIRVQFLPGSIVSPYL